MLRGLIVTFTVGSLSAEPNVDFASERPLLVPPSDHFQLTFLTFAALTVEARGEPTSDSVAVRMTAILRRMLLESTLAPPFALAY